MHIETDDNINLEIFVGSDVLFNDGGDKDVFIEWDELGSETQDKLMSLHGRVQEIVREAGEVLT